MNSATSGQESKVVNPNAAAKKMQEIYVNGLIVANELLNKILPELNYIKSKCGSENKDYQELSDLLALSVSWVIKIPLLSISGLAMASDFHSQNEIVQKAKSDLAEATRIIGIVSTLEMKTDSKQFLNQVINILNEAEKRVNSKPGCYIATSVYGDYNSKEVILLRSFRDNVLSKYVLGQIFIASYYLLSPMLVRALGENITFKKLVKTLLDKLVFKIESHHSA